MRAPIKKWILTVSMVLCAISLATGHGGGHEPPPPPEPPGPPPEPRVPWTEPTDVNSPRPRTPGPTRPGPSGPAPATPGPSGPAAPSPAPGGPTPRSVIAANGVDLTGWSLWWRFNRHAYLDLKDAIWTPGVASEDDDSFFLGHGMTTAAPANLRPTRDQVSQLVVPTLIEVLEEEGQPQVASGCLTALARIGDVPAAYGVRSTDAVIASFLDDRNQQMSETAAVSLGILGIRSSLSDLASLVDDDERGRELCGRSEVPVRTRAFAAYGIGMLANQSENRDVKRFAVHRLVNAFSRDDTGSSDLGVACVNALSLVELPGIPAHWTDEAVERSPSASREAMLRYLLGRFTERKLKDPVRAHLPRAMARLVGAERTAEGESPARTAVVAALLKTVDDSRADRSVRQGCIIGLGLLGDASEAELDRMIRRALEGKVKDGEPMSRHLALIALAQVTSRRGPDGSLAAAEEGTSRLLEHLAQGKSRSRPWAALALGVQGHRLRELDVELSADASAAVRAELADCRSPEDVGAYAIALGLRGDIASAPLLLEKLDAFSDDAARASIALAVAMTGDRDAVGVLQRMMSEAVYRPALLRGTAVALALLGDKSMVDYLTTQVEETDSSARRAVFAWALAEVGDVRAVDPVLAMLTDPEVPVLARGIATLAVGFICERGRVPWNTPLAVDVNYPANPESLFSPAGGGILNIR